MSRVRVLVVLGVLACRNEPTRPTNGAAAAPSAPSSPAVTATTPNHAASAAPSARDATDGRAAPNAETELATLGERAGSCDWTSVVSTCFEAVGATPNAREDAFRALAQVCKSVPARGPCPAERRVGSCFTADRFVEHYYATGSRPYTAAEARADCESREGRWLG